MFTVKNKYHTWEIGASGRTVLFLNGHVGCRAIWKSCRDSKDSTCFSNTMQFWSPQVVWLAEFQTRMLSPKSSAWKHLVCFCFQIKQDLDLSSGAMFVTLEYAISSLAAAEWLWQQGQMLPSAAWHWVEQNKPQKRAGRCRISTTPLRVSGKGSPSPHVYHKHRWAHFSTRSGGAMDVVRREDLQRERTELGAAVPTAQNLLQHGIFSWECAQML